MIKTSNIDAIMQPNRIVDGSFGNADDNEYLRAIIWELRAGGTSAFCSRSKHVNSQEPEGGIYSFGHVVIIHMIIAHQQNNTKQ